MILLFFNISERDIGNVAKADLKRAGGGLPLFPPYYDSLALHGKTCNGPLCLVRREATLARG